MANPTTTAALAWADAGYCVLPARPDGSKAPTVAWRQWQHTPFPRARVEAEVSTGFGLLCGKVSGCLEMLELEGRAMAEGAWTTIEQLAAADPDTLAAWETITRGPQAYVELTPSGGVHIHYRLTGRPVPGNTKLAARPARDEELTDQERDVLARMPAKAFPRVLAETRGEGGYTVTAPSNGPTHPTGKPWVTIVGRPGTVSTITAAQRDLVHALMRALDRMPHPAASVETGMKSAQSSMDGTRPGDDYNTRTTWRQVLEPHGWRVHYTADNGITYWTRPGKSSGISASTGATASDTLHVFTSSTEFDADSWHDRFGAYAVLNHGGDHQAASRDLGSRGYGAPADPREHEQELLAGILGPGWEARVTGPKDDEPAATASKKPAKPKGKKTPPAAPPRPHPRPDLDGGKLLDQTETFIRRYCILPSEAAYVAMTLWVAHTYARDAAESSPRLAFLSAEPESGKSRALEVLALLCANPMEAFNVTTAALFRTVAAAEPTILFDEIDTVFNPTKGKHNEEVRGLLNAGYRRGAVAWRCVGEGSDQEVVAFPAYAPLAVAGIGNVPDTILSRSIVIQMRRRSPAEQVSPFRRRIAQAESHDLAAELGGWIVATENELREAWPEMPIGLPDRYQDIWEPLMAIADRAGSEWGTRARIAATELVAVLADKKRSLGVQLLDNLRGIFGQDDRLTTAEIVSRLCALDDAPWAVLQRGDPIDGRRLGSLLRQYEIRSHNVRTGVGVHKGYDKTDFADAWSRYLPPEGFSMAQMIKDITGS